MTRAALYLRISQDATGQHLGVDRQREDCTELANTLGWDIAETYVDNDRSAYKVRPEYERMLTEIDAGEIDAIVVWHSDRLYRVVKDLGRLIDICKSNGTQIATVKMGTIDLTTPTGRLVAGMMAQVATYEGEAKADRWKRSWRQGREAGRWVSGQTRTYGYTQDGQIVPEEATIAREMAQRIINGEPILGVTRWLDSIGARGTRGSKFTPASVKRFLTSPRIAGWSSLSHTEQAGTRKNKDGQMVPVLRTVVDIVAEGDWEPLIDKETWESVQAMLTARTRPYVAKVSSLTKLIECGACGTQLITSAAKGTRTYRCVNRPGIDGCGKVSGNAEPIEAKVYAYTRTKLADPRIRKRISELRAEPSGAQAEIAALELRRAELEQELDEPGTPVATIMRAIARTKERQAQLLDELASRNLEPLPVGDEWPEDIRRRRALVDLVVKSVTLNPATKASRLGFDEERVVIVGR